MAKIVLSALISDLRGSLGGSVIANWKGQVYMRQKTTLMGNPQSSGQVEVREYFSDSVALWRTLTPVQKALWEDYAQSLGSASANGKQVGLKGIIPVDSRLQSGMNAFIGANQMALRSGFARVLTPPVGSQPKNVSYIPIVVNPGVGYFIETLKPAACHDIYAQKAAVWQKLDRAGSHAYLKHLNAADAECPAIPAGENVTITDIKVGHGHTMEEAPIADLVPCGIWVQMVVYDEGGRKGTRSELHYLWIT